MLEALSIVALVLASLPFALTVANVLLLSRRDEAGAPATVAILIPARDEEANIRACVEHCLRSVDADVSVVVGDDGSTDRTAAIVRELAAGDPRVRLVQIPTLPPGWNGKQHACHALAQQADRQLLLFLDADVRLSPEGAAILARRLRAGGASLVSGVPRQVMGGIWERLLVPMINTLLLGYLPMFAMRASPTISLAAACGQMIMVRRDAYGAVGGHGAIRRSIHDGLKLPRAFRAAGYATDLVDGSRVAACRMYDNGLALREGFMKNATEGMARPVALPIWTLLLLGGHVLPWGLLAAGLVSGNGQAAALAAAAAALSIGARVIQAWRCGEPFSAVLLHPAGVATAVALQWRALARHWRGKGATWRGRTYATGS